MPFPLHGRRIMLAADEDVAKLAPGPPSFLWLVDITDEHQPGAVLDLPGGRGGRRPAAGVHRLPSALRADRPGTEIPVAWFAYGLRVVDIADPHAPREVAHFLPAPPAGHARVSATTSSVDDRGLLYLIDRGRGLHILERT